MYTLILCLFLADIATAQDICRTPNGNAGTCVLLDVCTPLKNINKKNKKTPDDINFLRQSSCGLHLNVKPKVCCPDPSEWATFTTIKPTVFPLGERLPSTTESTTKVTKLSRPLTTATTIIDPPIPETYGKCPPTIEAPNKDSLCCGRQTTTGERIKGGRVAGVDEYPWLALIEYDKQQTGCGGSLISHRYVLTAAHCLGNTIYGHPRKVRLSEFDTSTFPTDTVETAGGGFEYVTVVVIPIEKEIIHPDFKRGKGTLINDIGLLKLTKNAPYTEFIRPICLPYEDITLEPEADLRLTVAGWGSNGNISSTLKQYVHVPYVNATQCEDTFVENRSHFTLTDKHICAGGETGRDSCGGDSGGPLMHDVGFSYIVVGVVSFGPAVCGQEGRPAVHTHVYKYIDWIRREMV